MSYTPGIGGGRRKKAADRAAIGMGAQAFAVVGLATRYKPWRRGCLEDKEDDGRVGTEAGNSPGLSLVL